MIRLNCNLLIEKAENRQPVIALATELVELSLHDRGCIDYDLYASLTADDRLLIYETWQTEADLRAHMDSPPLPPHRPPAPVPRHPHPRAIQLLIPLPSPPRPLPLPPSPPQTAKRARHPGEPALRSGAVAPIIRF